MSRDSTGATRRQLALAALGLAALSLALYARSVSFGFVNFDDPTVLLAHPQLYDEHSFWSSLRQIFLEYFPREEPLLLRDVSWAFDARIFGFQNPVGYHLGNVVLNAANVVLLFLFLQRATKRFTLAFALAAVFAVLPVHVEAVSWVMGRKDLLSAFLVLSALLAQCHELDEPDPHRRRLFYLVALLCLCLALISKIAAMTGFLVLALHRVFHAYLDGTRAPDAPLELRSALREVIPRVLPQAIVSVVIVGWYQMALAEFGVIGWRGRGPLDPQHLANVATFTPLVIGEYVKALLWPAQLSAFYRSPHVEIALGGAARVASVAIALAVVAGGAYCCVRRRDLAFYALAFLTFLLPYSNLVFVDIWRADRYLYLASFCALAIPATLLAHAFARSGRALRTAIAIFVACFAAGSGAATLRQQTVWQDDDALWRHEASLDEPSLLAIQSLAASAVTRAEHETDPAARAQLVETAHREIARGLARDQALNRQPAGYATSEQLQLSRFHYLLGRLGAVEGEALATQLAHFETAHAIAPNRGSAFMLAKLYLELADRAPDADRERLVRASWRHFLDYVVHSGRDPAMLRKNAGMIAGIYEQRFPFLRTAITEARQTYFQ